MANKTPDEIAEILSQIYEEGFGGKERGRYRISRSNLRTLSGRKRLEDSIIDSVIDSTYEKGLVVTDLGDEFSVIHEGVMHNYRRVSRKLVSQHQD